MGTHSFDLSGLDVAFSDLSTLKDLSSSDWASAESVLQDLAAAFPPFIPSPQTATDSPESQSGDLVPEVEARYRTLVEQIPAVVFMAFLDKGIGEAYVSPQIEALLGFSQEEWLNDPVRWYQQIHPDDKGRWSIEAANLFLSGQPLKSLYRIIARDGRVLWFHCEAKMVRSPDGRPWFIHGVGFDISELKRAEEALAKNEQMLRGLFDFAPDTVVVVNHDGVVVRVNAQVESMFGYTASELIGKPIECLIPDRFKTKHLERRLEYLHEPRTRPMGAGLELAGKRKDNSEFPVDIMLSPMEAEGGGVVIAVIRDITRRKLAEEALREYADRLKVLSRRLMEVQELERRNIALELHDEIGQLLTGLKLTLELRHRGSDDVATGLDGARNLVNELMKRVRNLSLNLRPAMLDDLGLLPTLLWHIEQYTAQTKVKVNFKHSGLERRRFIADVETATYRIIQEALTNVARHANVDEVNVRLWVHQSVLSLQVEDLGSGFALESLRMRETSGLAGMRERAVLLGGSLKIDSKAGKGTRLVAELSIGEPAKQPSSSMNGDY